jgi:hypothetical protein
MMKSLTTTQIDASAVGDALGYKNARSVSNRISTMKKKYNLPFGSGAPKGGNGATSEAKVPATPSKNRVTKSGPASVKKVAATKTPKATKGKTKGTVKAEDPEAAGGVEGDDGMSEVTHAQAEKDEDSKDADGIEEEQLVVEA